MLAADAERLAAGHEEHEARAVLEELDEDRGGGRHLLEVVEHEEHALRSAAAS